VLSLWTYGVDAVVSAILRVGGWLGGSPDLGILVTTFAVRLALIPLLGPIAVRTRARSRVVRRIKPRIKELDRTYRDDPSTLSTKLKELHRENGIEVVDWQGLVGALVQLPILIALFQAVLQVEEPAALTLLGVVYGVAAALVSAAGTKLSGQAEGAAWMLWLSGVLPVAICLWLGPGIGLYLIGFYGASLVQAFLTRERAGTPDSPSPGPRGVDVA
jgi:membrane protein insertase Oxa1/YidC/SpoIIIJ